jgi:hypothetical protein
MAGETEYADVIAVGYGTECPHRRVPRNIVAARFGIAAPPFRWPLALQAIADDVLDECADVDRSAAVIKRVNPALS